jgi:hypothetical protein
VKPFQLGQLKELLERWIGLPPRALGGEGAAKG